MSNSPPQVRIDAIPLICAELVECRLKHEAQSHMWLPISSEVSKRAELVNLGEIDRFRSEEAAQLLHRVVSQPLHITQRVYVDSSVVDLASNRLEFLIEAPRCTVQTDGRLQNVNVPTNSQQMQLCRC
jgi:hypothetical protein